MRINTLEILTDFTESHSEYVGGFVVRQVRSIINCALSSYSTAVSTLNRQWSLLAQKNTGGLWSLSPWVSKKCARLPNSVSNKFLEQKVFLGLKQILCIAISFVISPSCIEWTLPMALFRIGWPCPRLFCAGHPQTFH
jgi:hypothetical protein